MSVYTLSFAVIPSPPLSTRQISRLQMDHGNQFPNLHAIRGCPVLSESVHSNSSWTRRGHRRSSIVVCQVHLFDYSGGSLQCSDEEQDRIPVAGRPILWSVFCLLPNGADLGKPDFVFRLDYLTFATLLQLYQMATAAKPNALSNIPIKFSLHHRPR